MDEISLERIYNLCCCRAGMTHTIYIGITTVLQQCRDLVRYQGYNIVGVRLISVLATRNVAPNIVFTQPLFLFC